MKKQIKQNKFKSKVKGGRYQNNQPQAPAPPKLSQMSDLQHHEAIANYTEKLLVQPEKNIGCLTPLLSLTKSSNLKTCILALDSLSNVFTSVSPLQSISLSDHETKLTNMMKKQEYSIMNFQKRLVENYKNYIDILRQFTTKLKPQFFENKEIFAQFKKCIMKNLIKCVNVLWNFNYSRQILQILVKYVKNQQVQQTFQTLLADSNPTLMPFKVAIIKALTTLIIKKDQKSLPDTLVTIINSVEIDTKYLKKNEDSQKYKSKQKKRKQYKQKEFQRKANKDKDPLQLKAEMKRKRKEEKASIKKTIDKQFAQGQQNINKKQIVKQNADILQELFYLYFKILTRKSLSVFLKDSLDGILKFCHLISTDLLEDLIAHLNTSARLFIKQWENTKNPKFIEASFYIIFSSQSVINGPASIFNMLDLNQVSNFFKLLRSLNKHYTSAWTRQMFRMTIKILHEMFIKKRQLSIEIVGSFIRQIMITCTTQIVPTYSLLQTVRQLAFKYHKVHRMFEEDNEGFGINSFNPHIDDPQSTNAIYTSVTQYINALKKKAKSKDEHAVIDSLIKMNFQSDVPKQLLGIAQKQEYLIKE